MVYRLVERGAWRDHGGAGSCADQSRSSYGRRPCALNRSSDSRGSDSMPQLICNFEPIGLTRRCNRGLADVTQCSLFFLSCNCSGSGTARSCLICSSCSTRRSLKCRRAWQQPHSLAPLCEIRRFSSAKRGSDFVSELRWLRELPPVLRSIRDKGKRFVVRAEEMLTTFLELESAHLPVTWNGRLH